MPSVVYVGILTDIFRGRTPGLVQQVFAPPTSLGSPNAGGLAQKLVWQDYFKGELDVATRVEAMKVPAIAKARSLLVGIIADLPLRAYSADMELDVPWTYTTSTDTPVWHRMAWTIDDWIFYGESLWATIRGTDGVIIDVARVPYERWTVDSVTGEVLVDGEKAPDGEVIYLPGPFEGILAIGQDVINGARAIDRAWIGRVQNPIPVMELHQLDDTELDDDEVDEIVDTWAAARTSPTGAVGFTDYRVELRVHGDAKTDLFVEGRNASVLDVARLTTIPAGLLDGSLSTASLTYSTSEGQRSELLDFTMRYWTAPLESRLSMDDVVLPGVRLRFDASDLTIVPTPAVRNEVRD